MHEVSRVFPGSNLATAPLPRPLPLSQPLPLHLPLPPSRPRSTTGSRSGCCSLNEDVDSINIAIMNRFDLTTPDGPPAQRRTYQSDDSIVQGEQRGVYPTEFLNSLNMSGMPPRTFNLVGRLPGDFAAKYAGRPCKWHSVYCG
jgi:hypothetical protein